MKNDVVRWNAQNTINQNNFNAISAIKSCADFLRRVDVCVSVTAPPPPAPATHHERTSPAPATRVRPERPLAFAAINCDTNKFERSSPLVHESVKSSLICLRNLFVEVFGSVRSVPTSELAECAAASSCTTSYIRRSSRQSDFRRTRNTWSLTKFRLNFLRIICAVVLCNISVGVASDISADWPPNQLDYHEEDGAASRESEGHYTPTWAVHIPNGYKMADEVARDHGFVNLGKIFDDHYHFAHHKVSKRSLSPASHHQTRLDEDDRVHWARQQKAKSRSKRDFIRMRPSRTSSRALSLVDAVAFSDPKWSQMWYLNRGGGLDMNVIPAWKEGITGKGIVVTILDDGLESDHPDIEHNYDPKASYDVNSHDDNPMPTYDMTDSNRHGTRCAGEVAATANNSICAVGIAYGASVGGVRMLDGDVTDAVEARSLSLNPQHIDIYSASWGPDDDGKTVDGPGELASRAFIEGVTKGRNGKGSIFIWASGNGGRELDNCNCDGYTNSIWTLSISSATEEGNVPWYSEKCSSTLATTYSSGAQSEKQVVTTDLHHSCTVSHTGTSASAPLAAGIAALVLESNQNLTWRDLQHIVVRTAKPANLRDPTWTKNGVGRRISHSFGYGLMDAAGMVRVARTWKTVPEQHRCEINAPHVDKVIPPKGYITLQQKVKHCSSVNYLEHVQAKITLTSQRRGDIQLYLKSPAGTKVTLLTSRIHDVSRSGFNQWPFMSVHTWGESPQGNWQLEIHNEGRFMGHAMLREWSLILYGTTYPISNNDPKSTPRATSSEYTTPNTSSMTTTTNLHQFYSEQYPRISPNNFGILGGGGGLGSGKLSAKFPPNKTIYMGLGPAMSVAGSGNFKKQQQKQQSYQGILDSFDAILHSQPKNKSKTNGKGKPGELKGNKNNSNGKISSNKKDPSSSPAATPNNKNKFYRLSNSKSNKGPQSPSTSQRPKLPAFQSSERLQNFQEMQGTRKVIGDLFPMSNEKIPTKNTSPQTTSYSKLPVKAIKQIKESQTVLQSHEKLTSNDQRIPKMFERYEKIQAIFPEFQPYQGTKDFGASGSTTSDRQQFQANEAAADLSTESSALTSSLRPLGFNGGSKPSRENSKKSSQSFVQEQRQHVELKKQNRLLTVTTTASVRKVESANSQRPIGAVTDRQPINAQITQWDLIFHGTEVPAQPGDPVQINTGHFNPYGNDMDQNHLDFDPDAANGQWRNVEQVGESSLMTSDRTNTACLKATVNQRCLACAFPTFLFEGRCYQECPLHTFAEWDSPTKDLEENSFNGDQNEVLMSTDRKRSALLAATHEQQFNEERRCAACHPSCLRCHGALNSQCSTCFPGSQLRKALLSNDTYCYVFAERSSGNIQDGSPNSSATHGAQNRVFLMIIVPSVVVISCLVLLNAMLSKKLLPWRRWGPKDGATYSYDRVALLSEAEPEIASATAPEVAVAVTEVEEELAIEQHLHPSVIVNYVSEVESDCE